MDDSLSSGGAGFCFGFALVWTIVCRGVVFFPAVACFGFALVWNIVCRVVVLVFVVVLVLVVLVFALALRWYGQ